MTVMDKYFNWQALSHPDSRFRGCSPNVMAIVDGFLIPTYGGLRVGCFRDRPVSGGSSPSTHGFGAAGDWQYATNWGGPGESIMWNEIASFLIQNSKELGIQALHDYRSGKKRVWRPPGTSGRSSTGSGWHNVNLRDTGTWVHIEIHPDTWNDGRSVEARTRNSGSRYTMRPVTVNLRVLKRGDSGLHVHKARLMMRRTLQDLTIPLWGQFDHALEQKVRDLQTWFRATTRPNTVVDGVIGPQTWTILIEHTWPPMND